MAEITNIKREIVKKTYGIDLRKPIYDALCILAKESCSSRKVVVMTQSEYDSLGSHDPNTTYAIKFER